MGKPDYCCTFFLLLIFLLPGQHTVFAQSVTPGRAQLVKCVNDTTLQYSLYLPAHFSSDSVYPLLIFLDPSARGDVPVERYQQVAEDENIILAGSFNSKNFDVNTSLKAIPAMLNDIKSRMRISEEATWLSGFSGGSRMAAAYAAAYEGINGVIACGAGFAKGVLEEGNEFHTIRKEVPYAALVGDKDMNFEEMMDVTALLKARNKKNCLLVFDGGHEWPPVLQMHLAVRWLRYSSGLTATMLQEKEINAVAGQHRKYTEASLLYFAWLTASNCQQVPSLSAIADSLAGLSVRAKHFIREKEVFETVLTEEQNFMDQFSFLFDQFISSDKIQAENDELWKQKAAAIDRWRKDKDPYRRLSGQRLFDICWRLCAEQYSWLIETNKFKQAYSSAYILSFFDLPRTNPDFMMAKAAAGMADKDLCMAHLKKAVKKGNITKERMQQEELITRLLSEKDRNKLFGE